MIRPFLTAAAGLIALSACATAAQACLSCEYRPEVLDAGSRSGGGKAYNKSAGQGAAKHRKAEQARAIEAIRERKAAAAEARRKAAARSVAAKSKDKSTTESPATDEATVSVEKPSVTLLKTQTGAGEATKEDSATKAVEPVKTEPVAVEPAKVEPVKEVAAQAVAPSEAAQSAADAPAAKPGEEPKKVDAKGDAVGCKKFFPAVGVTLSVSCD